MKTLLRLSKLIYPLFPIMLLAILFGTLGFFCAISIPVLGAIALFTTFPVKYLFFIGILRGILHYAEQYCNHFIAFTLLARIRNIVFSKLRSLGPSKLEGREKGNLISLITSDIELLEVFYAHTISPVCIAFIFGLGMIFFLKELHWSFAVIAFIYYLAVAVIIPLLVQKKARIAGEKHRNEFAKMNSFLLDCLRGIQQSITYATGQIKLKEIKEKSDELSKSQKEMSITSGSTTAFTALFVGLAALSMLAMALHLYMFKIVTFQTAITAIIAIFSSFGPFIALANLGAGLSQTIAAGKRILSLLDEKASIEDI
nr:ABC transporter ATP-binding protein/permease [Treponema sp.]